MTERALSWRVRPEVTRGAAWSSRKERKTAEEQLFSSLSWIPADSGGPSLPFRPFFAFGEEHRSPFDFTSFRPLNRMKVVGRTENSCFPLFPVFPSRFRPVQACPLVSSGRGGRNAPKGAFLDPATRSGISLHGGKQSICSKGFQEARKTAVFPLFSGFSVALRALLLSDYCVVRIRSPESALRGPILAVQ